MSLFILLFFYSLRGSHALSLRVFLIEFLCTLNSLYISTNNT